LRKLLDAGLCPLINSDDPAYFGGYMNENWLATFAALKLDASHAVQLAKNSFEASFCDAAMKRKYSDRVGAVAADFY
jgi:adenosine deaminase